MNTVSDRMLATRLRAALRLGALAVAAIFLVGCGAQRTQIETDSIADVFWWDLMSEPEQAYWDAERDAFEQNPNHVPDSPAPPPRANPEYDGVLVRIPGFVVGVDVNPDDFTEATSFLFVPIPGACLHVPAPPVNQIILANVEEPVSTNPFQPYWLVGRLNLDGGENELAAFSYSVEGAELIVYELPEETADPSSTPSGS